MPVSFLEWMRMMRPSSRERSIGQTQGIETATFHILTPYPGTGLYQRWRQKTDCFITIGIYTIPATLSTNQQRCRLSFWKQAIGRPTSNFIGGGRSYKAPSPRRVGMGGCGTLLMRLGGKNSSLCGIGSSAPSASQICSRLLRRFFRARASDLHHISML
jgi:hypothetical protein